MGIYHFNEGLLCRSTFLSEEIVDENRDEYFFSSTRHNWNYFGIIIRIIRGKTPKEDGFLVYDTNDLKIYRTNFTGTNLTSFIDQIVYLGLLERVANNRAHNNEWFHYDGWGTYEYTAIELRIYTTDVTGRIGEQVNEKACRVIQEQFLTSRLRYYREHFFSIFCAQESIKMKKKWAYCCLDALAWQVFNLKILDIQSFGKGIDCTNLFENISLNILSEEGSLTIFSINKEYDRIRILKADDFKNSGKPYYFLYEVENNKKYDNIKYIISLFEENEILLDKYGF